MLCRITAEMGAIEVQQILFSQLIANTKKARLHLSSYCTEVPKGQKLNAGVSKMSLPSIPLQIEGG